jgi:hypothetical protein
MRTAGTIVTLLVLVQGLAGCGRLTTPSADRDRLTVFTDRASGFSTTDVRDADEQIVRFNEATILNVSGVNTANSGTAGWDYAQLIGPNARKVIFEDTGHVPMIERPSRFNPLVAEFLAGESESSTSTSWQATRDLRAWQCEPSRQRSQRLAIGGRQG